jgi:ABC-2 type transport system ATP-binding protein
MDMRTHAPETYPLEAAQVEKRYGEVTALRGVSLRVAAGSACGLVGPNGAGKSTLLRIVCGLARPDAGEVRVAGADPFRDPVAARSTLGCVPELPPLFELLTGMEQLLWVGRIRRVPDPLLTHRIRELGTALQLGDALSRRISTYSKGMRQKLAFVAALVHDPRILVLDEPFDGVDPLATRVMKAVIRQFVDAGAAVLLSSHMLPLVEDLCDAFAVLSNGRVVFEGGHEALVIEASRLAAGSASGGGSLEPVFWSLVAPDGRVPCLETVAHARTEPGDAAAIDR